MRFAISRLHERKDTSLKHVINGVRDNMYMSGDIFIMLEFIFYIIFVPVGGCFFLLDYWNFMVTSCAASLVDLFLFSLGNELLDNMISNSHRTLAWSFNLCHRYTDDLIIFNHKFPSSVSEIYSFHLTV